MFEPCTCLSCASLCAYARACSLQKRYVSVVREPGYWNDIDPNSIMDKRNRPPFMDVNVSHTVLAHIRQMKPNSRLNTGSEFYCIFCKLDFEEKLSELTG
jgi:hypothetical protein